MSIEATDFAGLAALFRRLGAPDPEGWARSQLDEGVPQLARYLFLRQAWREIVPEPGGEAWIEAAVTAARADPGAPFAGAGAALARLRALGADDRDLAAVARGAQAEALFAFCRLLGDPGPLEPEVEHVAWALVQLDPAGQPAAVLGALHESVLETDPTGREMRPPGMG